jgi:hypothetical protein
MPFQAAARKAASKHAWKNGSRKLIFAKLVRKVLQSAKSLPML